LPVAKAELPEDLFLAHARTDDGWLPETKI